MSRFTRSPSDREPQQKPEMDTVDFEGTYQCQACEETVYRAVYVVNMKLLTWKCSNGHKSFAEGISI